MSDGELIIAMYVIVAILLFIYLMLPMELIEEHLKKRRRKQYLKRVAKWEKEMEDNENE